MRANVRHSEAKSMLRAMACSKSSTCRAFEWPRMVSRLTGVHAGPWATHKNTAIVKSYSPAFCFPSRICHNEFLRHRDGRKRGLGLEHEPRVRWVACGRRGGSATECVRAVSRIFSPSESSISLPTRVDRGRLGWPAGSAGRAGSAGSANEPGGHASSVANGKPWRQGRG